MQDVFAAEGGHHQIVQHEVSLNRNLSLTKSQLNRSGDENDSVRHSQGIKPAEDEDED